MGHASRATKNKAPISASMAELMMFVIIFARTWTGLLGFGVFSGVVFVLKGLLRF